MTGWRGEGAAGGHRGAAGWIRTLGHCSGDTASVQSEQHALPTELPGCHYLFSPSFFVFQFSLFGLRGGCRVSGISLVYHLLKTTIPLFQLVQRAAATYCFWHTHFSFTVQPYRDLIQPPVTSLCVLQWCASVLFMCEAIRDAQIETVLWPWQQKEKELHICLFVDVFMYVYGCVFTWPRSIALFHNEIVHPSCSIYWM